MYTKNVSAYQKSSKVWGGGGGVWFGDVSVADNSSARSIFYRMYTSEHNNCIICVKTLPSVF